jgi:hypothetical protein
LVLLEDEDAERRIQAEVLLNAYSRELERKRASASSSGLLINTEGKPEPGLGAQISMSDSSAGHNELDELDEEDSSDEEFHYPAPMASPRSSTFTDYFSRASTSRIPGPADLTPLFAQAPDFRVPTHEAPQKILSPRWAAPSPHQLNAQWERDEAVHQCRDCQRRFNFITRRVRFLALY